MCGIVGTVSPATPQAEIAALLRQMNDQIHHRGPDEDGFFVAEAVGLAMRRLSIIDLAGGTQPVYNENRTVVTVFNGEIYNYRELTAELQQRGHIFTTNSDTETIVHLYEEMGEECVHALRGMFALAIWDARRHQLFVARDRLGIKPLYYTQVGNQLLFASEIKALLQHPGVEARLDPTALGQYLSLKYVPAPQTLFAGISSLPPGHALIWNERGLIIKRYWDLQFVDGGSDSFSERVYAERLTDLLQESVKLHLRSDVPFGAFLSGGVDSSTIVALMSQVLDEPVKTFSVGFSSGVGESDELPYARLVAQQFQTDHHEIIVEAADFINLAEKVIWHLDQPIADQATFATYMLSTLAAQQVKMVLTGEGGDELFAGYARYVGERVSPYVRNLPSAIKATTLALSQRLPGMRRGKLALYALCQPDEARRLVNWFPLFNDDMHAALISDSLKERIGTISAATRYAERLETTTAKTPLNRMLAVDTQYWLPDYLLLRGDKLTMAASLEARVPLLDHKLVEFAAGLPTHFKLNGWTRKYLLKQVARNLLPADVIDRKKAGFPIPIGHWFRHEARSFIHDLLSPNTVQRRGLFRPEYVANLLREHDSGFANHSTLLWGLASIELWQQIFLDKSQPEHA